MKLVLVFCGLFVVAWGYNPEENLELHGRDAGLYEGDMRLTIDQALIIEGGVSSDVRASVTTGKWPGAVLPYVIESSLSSESKAMSAIQSAMGEWEEKTCVRFKKRTTETAYVSFFKGSGCWSHVGRTGGKQQLSLVSGCWYHGTVVHEIGHALGFYHEQSRPDRDNHVTIMWDNIIDGMNHNFNKYGTNTIDSLGTPYDYGSIMHYSGKAFTKNGKPTIVAKKPGVTFGQRKSLSPIDAQQMSLRYSCKTASTISCNFDNGLCSGWSQSAADQFDWTVGSGYTPTMNTGPSADHSGSGKYMYIETSQPRMPNDKAVIRFNGYAGGSACLSFYYHMYGSSIGQLNVYVGNTKVFQKSGYQGADWKKAEVSINGHGSIVFEGIRGSKWRGDIAIDDFSLKKGSCNRDAVTQPPVILVKCGFEDGLCSGWSQSTADQFDWTVRSGSTPSSGTGPSADHSGSGKYIYIETSDPRMPNDKAVIRFNGYTRGSACLSFYYHMYGSSIGQLNVYLGNKKVFQKNGAQGNEWKKAEVSINGQGYISLEGIRGDSWDGDIAVDDFSLTGGSCGGRSGMNAPPPPPVGLIRL